MNDIARIARLGVIGIGLSIGAAVAATPGIASADLFPPPFDPNDFAISLNGMTLFQVGSATATSGLGDFAIADGAGSNAVADGGFGDFASADGSGSFAAAGSDAAGATGNNFDSASAFGDGTIAEAGFNGSGDSASVVGNDAVSFVGFNGSFDSVSAVGNDTLAEAGLGTVAAPANFDFASVWGILTATPNIATVDAIGGTGDLAFVVDPLGSIGSEAFAGLGNNFDLAGAWGDDLNVVSTLADFIFHIAPFF
jgi:hypothetical protein